MEWGEGVLGDSLFEIVVVPLWRYIGIWEGEGERDEWIRRQEKEIKKNKNQTARMLPTSTF